MDALVGRITVNAVLLRGYKAGDWPIKVAYAAVAEW